MIYRPGIFESGGNRVPVLTEWKLIHNKFAYLLPPQLLWSEMTAVEPSLDNNADLLFMPFTARHFTHHTLAVIDFCAINFLF